MIFPSRGGDDRRNTLSYSFLFQVWCSEDKSVELTGHFRKRRMVTGIKTVRGPGHDIHVMNKQVAKDQEIVLCQAVAQRAQRLAKRIAAMRDEWLKCCQAANYGCPWESLTCSIPLKDTPLPALSSARSRSAFGPSGCDCPECFIALT